MVISIIGSIHQKCTSEELKNFIDQLIIHCEGHTLRIDERFYDYLWQLGIEVPVKYLSNVRNQPTTDLLITLGGDGTLLRSAKLVAGTEACILGVNTGRLGFLANMAPTEINDLWTDLLNKRYEVEERSMIEVFTMIKDNKRRYIPALNEIAILKRDTASMIGIDMWINDEYIATFEGDGVIIATPTGSTAYALSVNGPIIAPPCPTFVICPIAPHMLNMRPIVIPDDVNISMSVSTRNDTFLLSTDGFSNSLTGTTKLYVSKSKKRVRMIKHPKLSFYDTLRNKLMWGQNTRSQSKEAQPIQE